LGDWRTGRGYRARASTVWHAALGAPWAGVGALPRDEQQAGQRPGVVAAAV